MKVFLSWRIMNSKKFENSQKTWLTKRRNKFHTFVCRGKIALEAYGFLVRLSLKEKIVSPNSQRHDNLCLYLSLASWCQVVIAFRIEEFANCIAAYHLQIDCLLIKQQLMACVVQSRTVAMPEWLRGQTWNLMQSLLAGSNPAGDAYFISYPLAQPLDFSAKDNLARHVDFLLFRFI